MTGDFLVSFVIIVFNPQMHRDKMVKDKKKKKKSKKNKKHGSDSSDSESEEKKKEKLKKVKLILAFLCLSGLAEFFDWLTSDLFPHPRH